MERMGYLHAVITQNVDNLHREAGTTNIHELHGNLFRLRCLRCGQRRDLSREAFVEMMRGILDRLMSFSLGEMFRLMPQCHCGGLARPDFVAFGEPVQDLKGAMAEVDICDVMLVVGTSGVVYPAAAMPRSAKSHGAFLVEINPKESELTHLCDLFLRGKAGELLPLILAEMHGCT
jgi:NAD-dependent deacetylase